MSRLSSSCGFTFVELMVSVAVILVLLGLLIPALSLARSKARMADARQTVAQLVGAIEAYANEDPRKHLPYPGPFPGNVNPFAPTAVTYYRYQESGDPDRAFSLSYADHHSGNRIDGVLTLLNRKGLLNLPAMKLDNSDPDQRLLDPWGKPYRYRLGLPNATRTTFTCPHGGAHDPKLTDWNWDADNDRESLRNGRDPTQARPYPYVYSWGPDGSATATCAWIYHKDKR